MIKMAQGLTNVVDGPLVSVIALCYNHSRFVVECLESIRKQTYQHLQLIVIDDESKDDSVAIIEEWISTHDVTCTFIKHTTNRGICKTVNEGLALARGKYISIIGTDDVWLPDKLEHQVPIMEQLSEEVGVIYSDTYRIDEQGNLLAGLGIECEYEKARNQLFDGRYLAPYSPPPEGDIFSHLVVNCFVPALTTLIRRSCYDAVGWYDERLCFEDWDMWLRISQRFKFAYSPIISAKYRIVSTSACRTFMKQLTVPTLTSHFLLREKCLAYRKISARDKEVLFHVMTWMTRAMYDHNLPGRYRYLWRLYRLDGSLRSLFFFVFAICRLRSSWFFRFYNWYLNSRLLLVHSKLKNWSKAIRLERSI
jgi:glycosyltransferase involved in cell wall biosynthesis